MIYDKLLKRLRNAAQWADKGLVITPSICLEAANAIEELLKEAKAMHTWIFLNSVDEQAAYDECGLTDEMNAALGYGGAYELREELSKEE